MGLGLYATLHKYRPRLPHPCFCLALSAFLSAEGGGGLTRLRLPTYRCPKGVMVTVMAHSIQYSIYKRLLVGTVTNQTWPVPQGAAPQNTHPFSSVALPCCHSRGLRCSLGGPR